MPRTSESATSEDIRHISHTDARIAISVPVKCCTMPVSHGRLSDNYKVNNGAFWIDLWSSSSGLPLDYARG